MMLTPPDRKNEEPAILERMRREIQFDDLVVKPAGEGK
jgi:hypothetical protein